MNTLSAQVATQDLIHVFQAEIGGVMTNACDARTLHKFLEVGRDFSNWIKDRIAEYGFLLNIDYLEYSPKLGKTPNEFSPNLAKTSKGGRPSKEYTLTLDMGKELSMVEKNDKGREARKYFINCERLAIEALSKTQYGLKQLPEPKTKKALPGGLTLEQQDAIKQIVKERVAELPKDRQAGGAIRCWSAIKKKYGKTYKAVEPEHFVNLVSLLARLPLEGELLDNTTPSNTLTIKLDKNAPLQRLSLKFETTGYSFDRWFVSNSMGNVNIMPIADDVLCLTESEWIKHMTQERGYVVGKQLSRT